MPMLAPPSARFNHSDQAAGLRRQFEGRACSFVPLVANPYVTFSSVVLERITTCFTQTGEITLLVDAADSSPLTSDMALLDLAACIERLDNNTHYIAARGLPRAHVDTRGSSAKLLDALCQAAPQAKVVLVHGEAADLARIFVHSEVRPVLLASDRPESVKHAYAACKLLAGRAALRTFDLLLCAPQGSKHVGAIAKTLGDCTERFFSALMLQWALIDPASDVSDPPPPELRQMLMRHLPTKALEIALAQTHSSTRQSRAAAPQAAWHDTH